MSHAQKRPGTILRSAALAAGLGLTMSAFIASPSWADTGSAPGLNGGSGKPCAGCVGNADDKAPPGQEFGGGDADAGYECDTNNGIGRTNPAHTGCSLG